MPPPPPNAVATVQIRQAPTGAIEVGATVQLQAEARNASGTVVTGQLFTGTSGQPAVAAVWSLGRITAVAPGTARISVTTAGVSTGIDVQVVAPTVLSVAVFPATIAIGPAGNGQFTASALGANGTIPGVPITWTSSNPAVATVDNTGRVTGVAEGTALIRARAGAVETARGVTVSTATLNLKVHRADFIQVAQTAQGTVPLVRGRPTAVRVFPEATTTGLTGVAIDVAIRRGGATLFSTRISTGAIPVTADIANPSQGLFVALPSGLDLEGASLHVTIDPDDVHPERDEWDNASPLVGESVPTISTVPIAPLRVRLVPLAPSGASPPVIDPATADALAAFMRLVYPVTTVEVSVRSAGIVTSFPWPDRNALSDALATVEIERLGDGFDGHYYGVHNQGAIGGIVGLGYLTARSSLGTLNGEVFGHEVGHNMGLGHPPGCGADGANAAYPYPNGQIGIPGWDHRTAQVVPASAVDMMSYCAGYKWLSGGYFAGILSVLRNRTPGTLRADPGEVVAIAVSGRWQGDEVRRLDARRLTTAAETSASGPVTVAAVDATGTVVATASLPVHHVADLEGPSSHVAGIITVPRDVAGRVTALWVTHAGATATVPLAN